MSLNWKEIDLILSELSMENALIQKVRQPDYKSLILDLYRPGLRYSLLISLNQGRVRLHKLTGAFPNQVSLQRFAQLLRSVIQGGRITAVHQLGQERIVKVTIVRTGETTILYIRLWGGNPNIIAVDGSGTILDAFFRRPRKGEISGKQFLPESAVQTSRTAAAGRIFSVRPWEGCSSFNSFIEQYYRGIENSLELKELRQRAERFLDAKEAQLLSSLDALKEKSLLYSRYERYQQQAELLKANLYRITKGATDITVENYFNGGEPLILTLDPNRSPAENVEILFKKYKKGRAGQENLAAEQKNIETQLRALRGERNRLFAEETDIHETLKKFRNFAAAFRQRPVKKSGEKIPGLQFTSGNFTILVGRTAAENDTLLRHYVRGNDYWLHTRDYPGGYVFIKQIRGKSVPLDTLIDAGNLALFFSKGRKNGSGELYYTQVKHLRRAKNGKKGLVLPSQEKNLSIRLDKHRLDILLDRETV